jgi:lipopolysaccharide biosynthesis glycosyltransferase
LIHIAVSSSAEYLPWAATMIRSCALMHPGGVRFTVLHDGGIDTRSGDLLRRLGGELESEVDVVGVPDAMLRGLPATSRFGGRVVWLRLFLPELLPENPRVLYLDADTFVVDSLEPLWTSSLEGSTLAAVANVVEPSLHGHVRALGLSDPRTYLNSGVLVLDLARMRAEGATDELVGAATRSGTSMPWFDQDALNVVYRGRWHALHPRWNAMNSLWFWPDWAREVFGVRALHEATSHPAVLHFEGPSLNKPWHALCRHPRRQEYRRAMARTPWAPAVQDRTLATSLIRALPERYWVRAFLRLQAWRGRPIE